MNKLLMQELNSGVQTDAIKELNNLKNRHEIWYKPLSSNKSDFPLTFSDDSSDSEDEIKLNCSNFSPKNKNESKKTFLLSVSKIQIKMLSVDELKKLFILNFLDLVGKVFTKVGMESFHQLCSQVLYQLKKLLNKKPFPFENLFLLQITIINISISDLIMKNRQQTVENKNECYYKNQQFEYAFLLSIEIFTLLLKKLVIFRYR